MPEANHRNFYENMEECRFRLQNTIVTYDGKPAYVHDLRDGFPDHVFRAYITILPGNFGGVGIAAMAEAGDDERDELPRGALLRKRLDSPKFNRFRPFKMGWANIFERGFSHASYLARTPNRQSRQGLTQNTCSLSAPALEIALGRGYPLTFPHLLNAQGFYEMVTDDYPSFEEALDTLRDDSSIAVDRKFATFRDRHGMIFLYHGPDRVGIVRHGEILLAPAKAFLREEIIETPRLPNQVNML